MSHKKGESDLLNRRMITDRIGRQQFINHNFKQNREKYYYKAKPVKNINDLSEGFFQYRGVLSPEGELNKQRSSLYTLSLHTSSSEAPAFGQK